ncbi:MAG TPA: DUF2207 domain-containing protein, partial [Acidimicrobiia bacterium]|nr:DUF2207 domain-containing protein [Acidimicrobiia bacterium]
MVVVVLGAAPALAKSYRVVEADVTIAVNADGSITVREDLTFSFDGSFSGAYRDIPVRPGEEITSVVVSENAVDYAPGAPTGLGSSGDPGSFGVTDLGSIVRVVWHYRASDERRTFSITYRMEGLAVAYDDVVDVNFKVWGQEWAFELDRLSAAMIVPSGAQPGEVLVWGHAASAPGSTSLGPDGLSPTLEATNVPSHQWVEMRVVFPRALLSSVDGAQVEAGDGLEGILADEADFAGDLELNAERRAQETRRLRATLAAVGLFLIPIPFGILWAFRRYGSEP